jgi:nicotinate phosphoribosyltransferase
MLLEFGTRRAFSPKVNLGGTGGNCWGVGWTSNVLAALKLGRKPSGTMAHALVMAILRYQAANRGFYSVYRILVVLLY